MADLLESAAAAIAVGRLIQLRLTGRFTALMVWLAAMSLSDLTLAFLSPDSHAYFWMWLVSTPLQSLFAIFAVRELFALVFQDYPGIRTSGLAGMYTGLALAAVGSLAVTSGFHRASGHSSTLLFYTEVVQRSVVFSLAVIIITILFFLSRYRLRLSANTYVSSSFFSAIFLSEALRLLLDSINPRLNNPSVDLPESLFTSLCMILWAFFLKRSEAAVPERNIVSTPREEHLLEQLASLNQMLSRAGQQ